MKDTYTSGLLLFTFSVEQLSEVERPNRKGHGDSNGHWLILKVQAIISMSVSYTVDPRLSATIRNS